MNIDIRTLILVTGITHCIQIPVLIYQYATNRRYPGIGWWLLWSAAEVAGFAFMLLREVPAIHRLAIIGQNSLIVSGVLFLYVGIMRFFEKKENRAILISIFAAFMASLVYFLYAHDDIQVRSVIIAATLAVISFISARATLLDRPRCLASSANFLSAVFLVHGGYFAYRALMQAAGDSAPMFAPTPLNIAAYLDALIVGILFVICLIVMVNQRLNADMAEAKERFELIFNASPDGVLITGLNDGVIVDINRGLTDLTGFTRDDSIGKSSLDIDLWENPGDRIKLVDELREKGICDNFEANFRRKDGSRLTGLTSTKIINLRDRPHILSVTRDITARQRAAEALAKQEKLYRTLFELAPSGILLEDAEGRIVDVNSTVCRNLGYTRDELVRMTIADLAPHEGRGGVKGHMARILAGETLHHAVKNIRKDGAVSFMELYETRFPLPDGTDGILVLSNDITERMNMETSLRESEEQFRGLFELSPVGIFLLDLEGNITAANDRGSAIYGYAREEMLRKNVREIVPKRLAGNYPRLAENVRRRKSFVFESEGRKKGGRAFPVELTVSLFPWKGKELLQILVRDVSEKRQAEEAEHFRKVSEALLRFQEEERKKIARDLHDHLGQDLAAIKIGLEMGKARLPAGEAAARNEIEETVRLVDKTIADVRSLSSSLRPASLDELGLVPCLRHELDYLASRGGLAIDLDAGRLGGRLSPEKEIIVYRIVQEAITNILKHARAQRVRVKLSRKEGLVRLSISDDGRGFHPEDGKSPPGLGLLGMRERVTLAGGKFALVSRPERGTRIVVTLPSAPEKGRKT